MKRLMAIASGLAVIIGVAGLGLRSRAAAASPDAKVERGRYLVVQVGLCGDCHSPADDKGQPLAGQELQGAEITFKPLKPVPNWAEYAPPITGKAGFTSEEQLVEFLMTGKGVDGKLADPPMPQFRFSQEDAAAIAAYLGSLAKK